MISLLIPCSIFLNSSNSSFLAFHFKSPIDFNCWSLFKVCKAFVCFSAASLIIFRCFSSTSSIVFLCFSKTFPRGEYKSLACSVVLFLSEGIISFSVRYIYLSILLDVNKDVFAASLFTSYYSFSSLILSSIVVISFYIFFIKLFLKCKLLSEERVVSFTEKEYGFAVYFL